MLQKLRSLQSSCLTSLSALRTIKTHDPAQSTAAALENVVKDQAERIANLEDKLEKEGNVYRTVIPAQAEYVKELEVTVEGMEVEINNLRSSIARDKDAFEGMVKANEIQRLRCERMESKFGMYQGHASEVVEGARRGRVRFVHLVVRERERGLVRRCFEGFRREGKEGREERVKMER